MVLRSNLLSHPLVSLGKHCMSTTVTILVSFLYKCQRTEWLKGEERNQNKQTNLKLNTITKTAKTKQVVLDLASCQLA